MECSIIYHQSIRGFCRDSKNCDCGPCLCVDPSLLYPTDPMAVEVTIPTVHLDADSKPELPAEPALDQQIVEPVSLPSIPTETPKTVNASVSSFLSRSDHVHMIPPIVYQPVTIETLPPPVIVVPPTQPKIGAPVRDYSDDPLVMATRQRMQARCQQFDLYKFCGITK